MDWIAIRGSCFVLRAEPPSAFRTNPSADGVGTLSYSLPGLPPNALNAHYFPVGNMSISHMVQTLQYFQKHSAFEVSRQRDKVRRAKYSRSGFSTTGKESTGGMSASAVPGALLGPEQKAAAAAKNATAKLGVAGGPFALHGASAMVVGRHASMVDNKVAAKNGAKNGASPGMGSLRMPPTGYGSPRVVAGFVGMPPVQAQMQVTMQMPGPAVQAHGATQRSMRMGTHAAGNGGMIATKQLTQQQLGTKGVVGAAGPPGNLGSSPRLGAAGQ